MRIGIDTFGCDHRRSGSGSYLFSLIANLPETEHNEIELFGLEIDRFVYDSTKGTFIFSGINIPDSLFAARIWHQFFLKSFIKKRGYDVVLYPAAMTVFPLTNVKPGVIVINELFSGILKNTRGFFALNRLKKCLKNAEKILLFSSANRIISTIVILPVLIIIPSVFYIKNKDFPSLTCSSFGFVSLLFYLLNDYCRLFNADNYLFALSLFIVISSFIETFVLNKKENAVVFVLSLIEFIRYSCHDDGITIFLLFILGAFALFVYTHILSGKNNYNFTFVTFVMSLMLIISMLFEFSKHSYISITPEYCVKYYISVSIALISMFIIPCFYCIKKRIKINYVQIAFCLLWIVNFILFSTCSNLNLEAYQRISSGISLGLIIAFSIFGLYLSYETTSIKSANYYLFFLSIAFIIRFFMISKGLVERGIVCIVCGICILAVNMIFSKKLAKTEENKIEQGE